MSGKVPLFSFPLANLEETLAATATYSSMENFNLSLTIRQTQPMPARRCSTQATLPQSLSSLPIRPRRPSAKYVSTPTQVALPLRAHPGVLDFTEPPTGAFPPRYFERIFNEPCDGTRSTHHRLRDCGHLIRTPLPTRCGRTCFKVPVTLTDAELPESVVPEGFACSVCLDELLDAKFVKKREEFEVEMGAIAIQLGSRLGTNLFVLPGDEIHGIRARHLRDRERMWAQQRQGDRDALVQLCGLRSCEAVSEDSDGEFLQSELSPTEPLHRELQLLNFSDSEEFSHAISPSSKSNPWVGNEARSPMQRENSWSFVLGAMSYSNCSAAERVHAHDEGEQPSSRGLVILRPARGLLGIARALVPRQPPSLPSRAEPPPL
ncbi:hypothetical protein NA57DRAFT_50576 [Rhizodiscina lignyota]|uniref:Uncharacterized protein n=1 Tax=Rhizodiscina lignyota TaxID=1504668 RepID=A0A9P4MAI1_9PEZI|nr:hypothetical protein NA57DRAFT_50576 [Rhizodiscina lignyota]